jgi:flavodoxin
MDSSEVRARRLGDGVLGDQTRRALMTSLAGLSLGRATPVAGAAADGRTTRPGSPILVACFSRTGNTRVVAGLIRRALGADAFEIRPAVPYPEDYLATVEQARQERDRGVEPALQAKVASIASYGTVFLGFPVWGETAPPVIRSFLSAHDLSGKALVPFITHGRYGLGDSETVVARHAPRALLRRGFSMEADQERDTMDRVNGWLRDLPVPR